MSQPWRCGMADGRRVSASWWGAYSATCADVRRRRVEWTGVGKGSQKAGREQCPPAFVRSRISRFAFRTGNGGSGAPKGVLFEYLALIKNLQIFQKIFCNIWFGPTRGRQLDLAGISETPCVKKGCEIRVNPRRSPPTRSRRGRRPRPCGRRPPRRASPAPPARP